MKILLFMVDHWQDILVIIVLLLSGITGLNAWVKKNGPIFKKMSVIERVAYITRLLQNLIPLALTLVTDAEIKFGGGTGPLKRSYVIDELYKRIPDDYKVYITVDNLDTILNEVLETAEKLWSENVKVGRMVYKSTSKPLVYEHDPNGIIGHVTPVDGVDGLYNVVPCSVPSDTNKPS